MNVSFHRLPSDKIHDVRSATSNSTPWNRSSDPVSCGVRGAVFRDIVIIQIYRLSRHVKTFSSPFKFLSERHKAAGIPFFCSRQPYTVEAARPRILDMELFHRLQAAGLFTVQLSLVLSNRPRRDGMLSWRCYTVVAGEI